MSQFVESITRTARLHCTNCTAKIPKGMSVIFELNDQGRMKDVFCDKCKSEYEHETDDDGLDHLLECGSRGEP